VANIFGDGTPVVFFGTNERVVNSNGVFLYGIFPDGNAHTGGAFPPGWPATVNGFIPDQILPYLGRGNPNSPCAADIDGDGKDEVINAGMGGLMVAIKGDGTIVQPSMGSTQSQYGENSDVDETASLPVINNPSIADLDGDGTLDIINGTAGLGLIRVASDGGLRSNFEHSISAWVSDSGFFQKGFPHRVWDYQFFMNYAVADLEGTGKWNTVSGDGGYFVYAPNVDGKEAKGFPKFTSGWDAATPALGDLDGDNNIDVVVNTREGWLFAWKTQGPAGGPKDQKLPAIQWQSFHHDDQNTANVKTPLHAYPRLQPPDDQCANGCCCQQTDSGPRSSSMPGLVALLALVGTLGGVARRRSRRV
jgi:hypothetical protein